MAGVQCLLSGVTPVVSDVWWEQGNHATWRDKVQLIYICVCVFASRYLDHLLARGRDKATARNSPRFSLRPMPHNNLQKYPPCSVGYSGPLWRASSQPSALSSFPGSNFFLPWTLKLVGGLPKKYHNRARQIKIPVIVQVTANWKVEGWKFRLALILLLSDCSDMQGC